jgi:hypothetical protein
VSEPCEAHRWSEANRSEFGPCPTCVMTAWRGALLYKLSREVAPSVPFGPRTHEGFDRAACRCGPASSLSMSPDGLLVCGVCDKLAPGSTQLAYEYFAVARRPYEPAPWHGLRPCHLCHEPARYTLATSDEYVCLSCGERTERQLVRAHEVRSQTAADEAAKVARERAWRAVLVDLAAPPTPPATAGGCLAGIDGAAALLARAGVDPLPPKAPAR